MSDNQSKASIIEERKANLPLPEQPPVASDFNSADGSATNVGSGGVSDTFSKGNDALRGPATGDSAARTDGSVTGENTLGQGVGREGLEGGIPNDAVSRGSKDKAGLKQTTGEDYPR
ncbi:hypothetical protein LTR17_026628 [Elasticomyces elasticus]|nr:hypothetical protein LTR27_004920 [Elasticomyces elasticus]KAK5683324.1 hypothetical protein LTS10_004855 [Elasticomyces elasticus]KAK5687951.1 hypothetical protein LTR17_026628 [Elasticomyces elasticus]